MLELKSVQKKELRGTQTNDRKKIVLCEANCYCTLGGMDAQEPLGPQELRLKCLSPAGHLRGREKLRQGYWTKPAGHGWGHKAPNVISLIQLHGHTTPETRLISKSVCLARVRAFLSICLFDNWNTNRFGVFSRLINASNLAFKI